MAVYTHGHHSSVLRSHNTRSVANSAAYLAEHLAPDAVLLDVGAGPGTITVDFAGRVARVTATEIDAGALSLSQALAARNGVTNIDFSVEDVHALSFADDSFDIVHAHQVLQHVGDPVQSLREMRRVAKPGGVVAARDADYAGFIWYPLLPELDDWLRLYRLAARANGGEPDAGRRLLAWARAAGFTDIAATASTWCYTTPAEREWWGGMWADRILESDLARQLVDQGHARLDDLRRISAAWTAWSQHDDGWFLVPHGEILCRV
ncbi:class I SAM-dependent methyltransferase [Microbacterium sp.]|uniref:class I SAM-dependent methyltransferase n=1 Tax=Microbacterium sp. TaxID=51671 RepID=UPI00281127DE|nr:class I SAM-dependent methyltransferase [Microbacterium sp.]